MRSYADSRLACRNADQRADPDNDQSSQRSVPEEVHTVKLLQTAEGDSDRPNTQQPMDRRARIRMERDAKCMSQCMNINTDHIAYKPRVSSVALKTTPSSWR